MYPALLVAHDWFEIATGVAQMITALAIVGVVVFAAGTAWAIRAAARSAAASLQTAQAELVPLLQQARSITADVQAMTGAARGEVERVRALVEQTTGKIEAGLVAAESRLKRLDALAGLVQDETEDAVLTVASTVRGTKATLGALRSVVTGMTRRPLSARAADDHDADEFDDDADDGEAAEEAPPARPRIARRGRRER
jgi:hypothetical protein